MRLMLVGRQAKGLSERLSERLSAQVELDVVRLPAEAIRRFDELPPDALLVCDEAGGGKVASLVKAIKNRPLGQLVPLLLVCPQPPTQDEAVALARELDLHAWLDPEVSASELGRVLAQELEVPYEQIVSEESASKAERGELAQASNAFDAGYLIEPLSDDEEDVEADHSSSLEPLAPSPNPSVEAAPVPYLERHAPVAALDRAQLFPARMQPRQAGKVTIDVIRRKLKEARHEDYYTILEVRRGVDGAMVRQAYQLLMSRFDPETLDFELARRFYHELAEIRDAFEDAYAVLGDPTLRASYTGTRHPARDQRG